MDIFTDSNDQPKIILHLHNITAFLSLQLEPSQAGRKAANWEIRLLISAICALVLPAAACQGFVGRDNWKLERRWQSHGSLNCTLINPSRHLQLWKNRKSSEHVQSTILVFQGFWEVQETSNKKTSFKLILFDLICVSVNLWNSNYGRVRFLHKTRSKWFSTFSFDPVASCSSKSRFRRSTCTWSDQKQCGGQVFVET